MEATCRGSYAFGTACGRCSKCHEEKARMEGRKTLGQVAYEAYCDLTKWKSLATGQPLPMWKDLKIEVKSAWEASASAVKVEILSRLAFQLEGQARN